VSRASVREGRLVQQHGLDRLRRLFVSSRWAVEKAVSRFGYQFPESKIEVVRIGANLPCLPTISAEAPPASAPLWLTWVGNFWERKGGDFAVAVVAALRESGLDASLDVVGAVEPRCSEPWLRLHGPLSYEDSQQFEALRRIYDRSAALILPSEGDTTPLAICEAFAFGRPVIASPVGAIPEMVSEHRTGLLLEKSSPRIWADKTAEVLHSGLLWEMRAVCRKSYEADLNWEQVCRRMLVAMRPKGMP
jgi:glycosyltransferase involved in cell wall biosynthesis